LQSFKHLGLDNKDYSEDEEAEEVKILEKCSITDADLEVLNEKAKPN